MTGDTNNADVETDAVFEPISDAEADAQWEKISEARRRVGEVLVELAPALTPDVEPEVRAQAWPARIDGLIEWSVGVNTSTYEAEASLRISRDVESVAIHRAVNEMCEAALVTGSALVPEGYTATAHRRSKYGGGAGISLDRIRQVKAGVGNEEEAVALGTALAADIRALADFVAALDLDNHFRSIIDRHSEGSLS